MSKSFENSFDESGVIEFVFILTYILVLIGFSILMFFKWYGYHLLTTIIPVYYVFYLFYTIDYDILFLILITNILILYLAAVIKNFQIKGQDKFQVLKAND